MLGMNVVVRGTVTQKVEAYDPRKGEYVYVLVFDLEDDAACEGAVVVDRAMYERTVIRGFGADTLIEHGTVCRIVSGGTEQKPASG